MDSNDRKFELVLFDYTNNDIITTSIMLSEVNSMILFSIPIYNYSPEVFYDKINNEKNKFVSACSGEKHSLSPEAFFAFKNQNKTIYENYIVGFLNVVLSNDISYELFITQRKNGFYKMPLFTSVKHYMSKLRIDGMHTIIYDLSNKEISRKIKKDITDITKLSEYKNLHFDLENFNLMVDYIDYLSIKTNVKNLIDNN